MPYRVKSLVMATTSRRLTLSQLVARRVSNARAARGVTQDVLAERLGTATRNLQRMESGRQNLTLGTLERIAAALDIDPRTLLPGASEGLLEASPDGRPPRVVPVVDLAAAAGLLRAPQTVSVTGWWIVDAPPGGTLFVARVEGDSLAPAVPSGSFALFEAPAGPVDTGAVVLWQVRTPEAPEDAGSYVLKRLGARLAEGREVMRRFGSSRHAEQRYAMHDTVDLRPVARLVRVVG